MFDGLAKKSKRLYRVFILSKCYLRYVHLYTAAYLPDGNVSNVQHLSLLVILMLLQSSQFDPWCFIFLVEFSDD